MATKGLGALGLGISIQGDWKRLEDRDQFLAMEPLSSSHEQGKCKCSSVVIGIDPSKLSTDGK